jgi:hypothetical protein
MTPTHPDSSKLNVIVAVEAAADKTSDATIFFIKKWKGV